MMSTIAQCVDTRQQANHNTAGSCNERTTKKSTDTTTNKTTRRIYLRRAGGDEKRFHERELKGWRAGKTAAPLLMGGNSEVGLFWRR